MIDPLSDIAEYQCKINLNLYDSPQCDRLATQAAAGRHLWILPSEDWPSKQMINTGQFKGHIKGHLINCPSSQVYLVKLCEDDYNAWLPASSLNDLELTANPYIPQSFSEIEIQACIHQIVQFAYHAMDTPNQYLWGGTVGPHYDCSGLVQAAFGSAGIWLPRDAYQQEGFVRLITLDVRSIMLSCLEFGDLIFFGVNHQADHVGIYLGDGRYIHSSGMQHGRNGIGIDVLSSQGDAVSRRYLQQLRGVGRVIRSYESSGSYHLDS